MSDEFERCSNCGAFDPRTTVKFNVEFKKEDMEDVGEILEIPCERDMCLDEEQIKLIEDNNIQYVNLIEIQICSECGDEFSGIYVNGN